MNSKTATKAKRRRTTMVPVTTMVEIPVLSEKERTELLTSLKKAELRAKANKATDYDLRLGRLFPTAPRTDPYEPNSGIRLLP